MLSSILIMKLVKMMLALTLIAGAVFLSLSTKRGF